jgi:hypothetical protein
MLNITLGAESCPGCPRSTASTRLQYERLCEPVLWFTARNATVSRTTILQHSLFSNTSHQRIGVTVLVAEKIPPAVNAALNPFIDVRPVSPLSPLFSTPQRLGCHLSDTIFNSSDVLAVLKHDLQLSALTSPSAFNRGQNSSIMRETGTDEAVLWEASLPGAW